MQYTNLINVPSRNPTNEPKAERKAFLLFLAISSPISAPKNGPNNKPPMPNGPIVIPSHGRTKILTISPMVLPHIPDFVPWNFFVPQTGI